MTRKACDPTVYPSHDDLLWAAGFFDGEGCVSVYRTYWRGGRWPVRRSEHRGLYLSTAQKVQEPLDFLRDRWGGSVSKSSHKPGPLWIRRLSAFRARAFLKVALPYLRVKGADAERGLRLELSQKQKENGEWQSQEQNKRKIKQETRSN